MADGIAIKRLSIFIGELFFCGACLVTLFELGLSYPVSVGAELPVPIVFLVAIVMAWGMVALVRGVLPNVTTLEIPGVPFAMCCLAVQCVPGLVVLSGTQTVVSEAFFLVSLVISGLAAVYAFAIWDDIGSNFGAGNLSVVTAITFIGGAAIFFGSHFLPLRGAASLALACYAFSIAFMAWVWWGGYRLETQSASSRQGEHGQPTSLGELTEVCERVAVEQGLSPRETEVIRYLARGRNARFVADELAVSEHTVKSHMYRIYKKLDVHTSQELIDYIEAYPDSNE